MLMAAVVSIVLFILLIRQRIDFKISLIAFKIKHKLSPDYLIDIFEDYKPTTNIGLRVGIARTKPCSKSGIDHLMENYFTVN